MNLVAETVQEMRTKHNLSTRGMAWDCPHVLATILHLPHMKFGSILWWKQENSAFPTRTFQASGRHFVHLLLMQAINARG